MGDQVYTPQVLVEMSRKLTDYANEACCRSTDENRIWSREQKADNEIDESGKQYFPISMEEAEALMNTLYSECIDETASFTGFDSAAMKELITGIQNRTK